LVGIEFENFNLFENDTGEECVVSGESSRFGRGEGVLTLPPMLLLFLLNRSFGEQNALALDIPVFVIKVILTRSVVSHVCGFAAGDAAATQFFVYIIRRSRKRTDLCTSLALVDQHQGPQTTVDESSLKSVHNHKQTNKNLAN